MNRFTIGLLCVLPWMMMSQTSFAQEVRKVSAGEGPLFGITYSLPKTAVKVTVDVTCKRIKAGVYAPYAEKLLGITDAPQEDAVIWEVRQLTLDGMGVTDTSRTYHIDVGEKVQAPTFYLAADGRLLSINREPDSKGTERDANAALPSSEGASHVLPAFSIMNEDLLRAGSKAKQAEVAARQIFRIRASRLDILTGEADKLPADGAAYQLVLDNLEAQEKAYMALFTGECSITEQTREFSFVPLSEVSQHLLFRFSQHFGIVDSDDLSGVPYYLSVTILEDNRVEPVVETDPKAKKKEKVPLGIAYIRPGKAHVSLNQEGTTVVELDLPMGQFGNVLQLPASAFMDKKKPVSASFHPLTGSLKLYEQQQ